MFYYKHLHIQNISTSKNVVSFLVLRIRNAALEYTSHLSLLFPELLSNQSGLIQMSLLLSVFSFTVFGFLKQGSGCLETQSVDQADLKLP